MSCWNYGKKGDFAGQIRDEYFRKMEPDHYCSEEDEEEDEEE